MTRQAAQQWLASEQSQMTRDLTALCDQNSGSYNPAGLNQVADWLVAWMSLASASVTRIDLPPLEIINDFGQVQTAATGQLLRWDFRPSSRRRVLLAIHYDTVYGPQHNFKKCTQLSDDLLRGPGVADAKGGIVVLRYALQALCDHALLADIGWSVVLNPDEELGSPSSVSFFQSIAPEFDFGLLFEPALPSGALVSPRQGTGNFTVVIRGRSAHAGRDFASGRNAVAELSRLVATIDQLNGVRDGVTINVGRIAGGGPVNVVPDLAVARINVRVPDEASMQWFEFEIAEAVRTVSDHDGFSAELHGRFQSPPKRMTTEQRTLMNCVEQAAAKLGETIQWQATGGVCDGNKLAAAGLPNIDTLGPLGDGLHSDLETVRLSSLVDKSQLIVEILASFAAGEFPELERHRPSR